MWKQFQMSFKNEMASLSAVGTKCKNLAEKWNIPFINGEAQAGCPGIMSSLRETPKIEFQWEGTFFHHGNKIDKGERFDQFLQALITLDEYDSSKDAVKLEVSYKSLSVYGRSMFTYIVNKNTNVKEDVFTHITPYAKEGLDLNRVPYGKGGA